MRKDVPRKQTSSGAREPERRPAAVSRIATIGIFFAFLIPCAFAASAAAPAHRISRPPNSGPIVTYHFTLKKGTGVPVCKADLDRMNNATYTVPHYCGRPEQTTVPGFTPLHRVPLSAQEVYALYERVNSFMGLGVQDSKRQDEANAAERKKLGLPPLPPTWPVDVVRKFLQRGYTKVWRFDPPVDIDNDGVPDNLVVWQGAPVSPIHGVCGFATSVGNQLFHDQPQLAIVAGPGQRSS